ncbi:MAG: hypothetical protein LIP09_12010 [Bacteroidales bacterium]|nr:hypothetical protein [Bacteroidales bacterium]
MARNFKYAIIKEQDGEKSVFQTATTKREIEKWFNRWMRTCKKDQHVSIERRNLGWFIEHYFGEWGNPHHRMVHLDNPSISSTLNTNRYDTTADRQDWRNTKLPQPGLQPAR